MIAYIDVRSKFPVLKRSLKVNKIKLVTFTQLINFFKSCLLSKTKGTLF